jgi:hypothetical protein
MKAGIVMNIFKKFTIILSVSLAVMAVCVLPTSAEWKKNTNGDYFYILDSGKKATGFTDIKDNTYYFDKTGKMLTGKYKISGKTYTFGADGKLTDIDGKAYKFAIDKDFLAGTFGDSLETLKKKNPNLFEMDFTDTVNGGIDVIPGSMKIGDSYAISVDTYYLDNDQYHAGIKEFIGKTNTVPDTIMSDSDYTENPLSQSDCDYIVNAYEKEFTEKYGEKEYFRENEDGLKAIIFRVESQLFVIISSGKAVNIVGLYTSYSDSDGDYNINDLYEYLNFLI